MSRSMLVAALLVAGAPAIASAGAAEGNPLGQVLSLMNELAAKVTHEGEVEAKAYQAYVEWCDDVSKNGKFTIQTAEATKGKLEATIGELSGTIEADESSISDLAADISAAEADLTSAKGVRDKENADFAASEKELVEAIDTLGRAVTILERQMQKNPAALAQLNAKGLNGVIQSLGAVIDAAAFTASDKNRLMMLVQNQQSGEEDDGELGAPAPDAYKTHSSSIFDVLEDLKEKAESELSDLRKAETAARHNYEMMKQSLEDQLSADNKDMAATKASKASAQEGKAVAQGDLDVTIADLKESKESYANAQGNCMNVAADHQATCAAREEELKVIAKATEILKSTSSGATEQTYSFFQADTDHQATVAIRSSGDLARSEIVALVKKLARENHSAALAQLASRISAVVRFGASSGEDPFAKVRTLIQDMLTKLESEGNSEATEKQYCDEEMAKTATKKGELDHDIDKLTSKIDQAASRSAELKDDVKVLQNELYDMAKESASNEKWRQEAHGDYVTAKSELELGLAGVRKALVVLRDYYAQEDGSAASFMEQPAPPQHAKATGAGQSIIGILEVVESDFANNLAKEETEEATAQDAHDKWVQEYRISTTMKNQDVKYKKQEYTSLDKSLTELSSDRETSSTELSAVLEYFSKLKQRCIIKAESYEERKGRREAELEGLKEALKILEGESMIQKHGHGHRNMRGNSAAVLQLSAHGFQ
jgi:hypothetical protein